MALLNPGAMGGKFNITVGQGRSINDLVEVLKDHFPDVQPQYFPRDSLMPERGTLSIEKAKALLGYKSEFGLEKGFARHIERYKEFASVRSDVLVNYLQH